MDRNKQKPWYKIPLVWMLICIPLSAVIAGIATIIIAVKTDDGLVKDDYYTHGKEINRVIKRDKAASALGLSAQLQFNYNDNTVTADITSKVEYTIPELIEVELLHATQAGHDKKITLQQTPKGGYFSIVPALAEGHWIIQLSADNWRISGDLYKPGKTGIIITSR